MDPAMPTLAERLRQFEARTSRPDVAAGLNVNTASVLNLMRGALPKACTLARAALLLGCSTDELLVEWEPALMPQALAARAMRAEEDAA